MKCEKCNIEMLLIHTWSEVICDSDCCTSDTKLYQCPECKTIAVN